MAKFIVDVKEIVHYQIEVEAESAKDATLRAEVKFFDAAITERRWDWEYSVEQNFSALEEVDEEA